MRAILFALAVLVIFTVFVTVFAASAQASSVRVLPKWLWVVLCVVATPIGGLLYLTLGRPQSGPAGKPRASTRLAPDDDPEFLRNLARKLREPKDKKPEANPEAKPDDQGEKDSNG